MGNLTNQYVSQSYQGLLKLDDSTTGVTGTLQHVQDGVGNNLPIQVSTSSVVITGSFYGNGANLTGVTASPPDNMATTGSNTFVGNQVISGSLDVTNGITGSLQGIASNAISSSHAINADTASFLLGTIASASFAEYAVTASIANDLIVRGKCSNVGGLTKGTIVRINGADGDNPTFDSASWINDTNSANTLGMLTDNVAHNDFANVVVQGKVIGINTSGMTAGDLLFLSSSGQYTTSSVPAPYHEVRLGQVLRANTNNGSVYISIDNGYEISELHDVDIQSVAVGDVLTYVSGAYGQWVNKSGTELGYATTGSNTFVGNQVISGSIDVENSIDVNGNSTFDGQTTYNNTIQYNADSFIKSGSQINFNIGDGLDGAYYRLSRKVSGVFGIVQDPGNHHLLDISTSSATFETPVVLLSGATGSFYGDGSGLTGVTAAPPDNMATTGSNTFIGDQTITGSIRVKGDLIMDDEGGNTTILLNQNAFTDYKGYYQAWLEPTNKVSVQAFERDINLYYNGYDTTGGTYDNGLFIDVDSSGTTFSDQLLPSYNRRNWLNIPGGAASSPQFKVGLGITGSLYVSGSDANDVTVDGKMLVFSNSGAGNAAQIQVSGSYAGGGISIITAGTVQAQSGSLSGNLVKTSINHVDSTGAPTTLKYIGFSANPSTIGAPSVTGVTVPSILAMNGSSQPEAIINFQHRGAYTDGTMTVLKPTDFKSNVNVTGSILQSGSLPNEFTRVQIANSNKAFFGEANTLLSLVGDSEGIFDFYADGGNYDTLNIKVTQNSGSLFRDWQGATYSDWLKIPTNTGSNPAPQFQRGLTISGSLVQSGSVNISGSVSSEVKDITVSSQTGSIDLNTGNFFNVPLGTASTDIRLEFSNVKPGQTVNVKVVPDSTNTVSFGPNVLQPSGSAYVPTQTSGSIDVLTLVSFDSTNLLLASVNNLV